jgi:hypothetical protein
MPLLPHAHAASLLRRDASGRTVFFRGADKRCYIVPDLETEKCILRKLRRIRFAELSAWLLFAAALFGALVVTDGGVSIPKWLFILGFVISLLTIELPSEWARRQLAHDLVLHDGQASKPSLLERLPGWVVVIVVAVAVGLAIYFEKIGPLKAIAWLDDLPLALHESKALAKVAVCIGGTAAVLWGGIGALKKWVHRSRHPSNPVNPKEKTGGSRLVSLSRAPGRNKL